MRRYSKKGICMHSLSVSVCPCLSGTVCSYFLYGHMLLQCSDMLSSPNWRLKTGSSSSWGSSPMSFLTRNTCFMFIHPMHGFSDMHLLKFIVHSFTFEHTTQLSQFGTFAAFSCTRHSVYMIHSVPVKVHTVQSYILFRNRFLYDFMFVYTYMYVCMYI